VQARRGGDFGCSEVAHDDVWASAHALQGALLGDDTRAKRSEFAAGTRRALGIAALIERGAEPLVGQTVAPRPLVAAVLQNNPTECGPAAIAAVYGVTMVKDVTEREQLIGAVCRAGGVSGGGDGAPTRLRRLLAASGGGLPLPLEALLWPHFWLVRLRSVRQQCFAHSAAQLICRMMPRSLAADQYLGGEIGRFLQSAVAVAAVDDVPLRAVHDLPTRALPQTMRDFQQHDPAQCIESWLPAALCGGGQEVVTHSLRARRLVSHHYSCSACGAESDCTEEMTPEPMWCVPAQIEVRINDKMTKKLLDSVSDAIAVYLEPPPPTVVDCVACGVKAATRTSLYAGGVGAALQVGQFLLLQLMRFGYNDDTHQAHKLSHAMNVPERLRVGRALLRLVGAVSHRGSSVNSGHYVAYVEHRFSVSRSSGNGAPATRWIEFDDMLESAMPLVSVRQALQRMQGSGRNGTGQQPYLLLYERDGDDVDVEAGAAAAAPLPL
jgi:hypothetical protein